MASTASQGLKLRIVGDIWVNQLQAHRMYKEGVKWFHAQVSPQHRDFQPDLTVIVGDMAPGCNGNVACYDRDENILYMAGWVELSPYFIAEATVLAGIHQFISLEERKEACSTIYRIDRLTFIDVQEEKHE